MRTRSIPSICLSTLAATVLSLSFGCGCRDVEDDVYEDDFTDAVSGVELQTIRDTETGDDDRCAAGCRVLAERDGTDLDEVLDCVATGSPMVDDPWNAANDQVSISCTGMHTEPGFCTGRRPQGHHEVDPIVGSTGRWLAIHAHLERASVRAFRELADWLVSRGAPNELVARCRAAADDEVVHADLMTALAADEGTAVPACEADAPADDPFAVALHNAVEGCVHEAFAAIVARAQGHRAERAQLREVFGRIADDELAHGQLAWDLHVWLMGTLSPAQQREVERAQANALARLPQVIANNARATPPGLGWPTPTRAAEMAERYAALVRERVFARAC